MSEDVAMLKGLIIGQFVEHEDQDMLNNQRQNIRMATNRQNQGNVKMWRTNTSGYKGVSLWKEDNRYHASIRADGKVKKLGSFQPTEQGKIEAAYAYTVAAKEVFGKFACYQDVSNLLDSETKDWIRKDVLRRLETLIQQSA
jgi:hypothetical protein